MTPIDQAALAKAHGTSGLPKNLLASLLLCVAAACSAKEKVVDNSGAPHMRPAEQGASSAVYFMLRNPGADTLVLHGVEIDVAGDVSLHRSREMNDMAGMHPVDSIIVLPHDSVAFAERGLHIMASNMRTTIKAGDTIVARLLFRPARVDTLRIPVRE